VPPPNQSWLYHLAGKASPCPAKPEQNYLDYPPTEAKRSAKLRRRGEQEANFGGECSGEGGCCGGGGFEGGESKNRSIVVKTKTPQIDRVDWALERRQPLEGLRGEEIDNGGFFLV